MILRGAAGECTFRIERCRICAGGCGWAAARRGKCWGGATAYGRKVPSRRCQTRTHCLPGTWWALGCPTPVQGSPLRFAIRPYFPWTERREWTQDRNPTGPQEQTLHLRADPTPADQPEKPRRREKRETGERPAITASLRWSSPGREIQHPGFPRSLWRAMRHRWAWAMAADRSA